jgi:ferredoxin-thioredoxin reductase catalytic subunit
MTSLPDEFPQKKENTETMLNKNRKYNIESVQNESTKFLYQRRLTNKLNQNEFVDTEEMYNYLNKCIHEAAKEALREKLNKKRKTMFRDAEIEKKGQCKKQLFLKWLRTKDNNDKVQYKKAQA